VEFGALSFRIHLSDERQKFSVALLKFFDVFERHESLIVAVVASHDVDVNVAFFRRLIALQQVRDLLAKICNLKNSTPLIQIQQILIQKLFIGFIFFPFFS
jgi:hypothetical protein